MPEILFIDTFPAFLDYWFQFKDKPLDDQIEAWASKYLYPWPDLLAKQVDDYSSQNVDWRQIACEKVFPSLGLRLPAMQRAHNTLLELCETVFSRVRHAFGYEGSVSFVLYVGLGCGAGWATTFRDTPTVLFGLENIAECGWDSTEAITGLIAHELGHLMHHTWRAQSGKPIGTGSWWQLYEEGFAQYCESTILGSNPWHQETVMKENDWMSWCRDHRKWLASEFLRLADAGESTSSFFGSWFNISGRSETGYYLGYEALKKLVKQFDLKEIANLENIDSYFRPILDQMVKIDMEK